MSLSAAEQAKVAELTTCGLPEEAAIKCAKAITAGPNPAGKPVRVYGKMVLKEGADIAALTQALKDYGSASAAAPGQLGCDYAIVGNDLTMFETMDSVNAMDIHVGHCFPHFVKMLPHVEMDTLVAVCDPSEQEYWNVVCNSWGAKSAGAYPSAM
jgi:hypothetical protein